MEATAGVAAARGGGSLPMSASRKEWRAVSEHHHRNAGEDAESERSKMGQYDERTIYEHGREAADVEFCSIRIDGNSDNDILQHRFHTVSRQREELQQMEVELRAQIIARSEIMKMQSSFDSQIKERADTAAKLQEQLQESELTVNELERKMEEKDRELHAIKLANEAVWAKEDLLREQDKELTSFRRERDHSEVERVQHIKQIQELQEHIQEKERLLIDLQEQHRVTQETMLFKDDQMREAQSWIARVQEMDALQSTTNHSLQNELRERTEQYNQLWLGCQRQFVEMERLHIHTIQQLQLELADARERSGTYTDESRMSQINSKDAGQFDQTNDGQLDANGGAATSINTEGIPNGNSENVPSFAITGNASIQKEHAPGVAIAPTSMLGLPTYLPPGQVTALHPYVIHQLGVPHSIAPNVPQSHDGHLPSMSSLQQWQNQQAASDDSQVPTQDYHPPSQTDQNMLRSDAKYEYDHSVNGQAVRSNYLDAHNSQGLQPQNVISSSTGEAKVFEAIDRNYMVNPNSEKSMRETSSHFHDALSLDSHQSTGYKKQNVPNSSNHEAEAKVLASKQPSYAPSESPSDAYVHSVSLSDTTTAKNSAATVIPEALLPVRQENVFMAGKATEIALLDERALLACIVRTIPPGGRIRISSTLPNRLGKILAPLHWHDYNKKYGKLDDFVTGHPELFVIEEDSIQLREGAQEMIAATAAVAKVAAAAAASSPYSSIFPSVAVTPMAQSRLKKVPSMDSDSARTNKSCVYGVPSVDPSQYPVLHTQQHPNGVLFGTPGGNSSVKILSKSRDPRELNGTSFVRSGMTSAQNKGTNFVVKQQGRTTAAPLTSRR